MEDIWVAINQSSVIVADVTAKNPNVMYEIGIAHTLGKNVILLTQGVTDIPFDFRRYRHIEYADNIDGFAKLERELPNYLRERRRGGPAVIASDFPPASTMSSKKTRKSRRKSK